MFKAFVLVRNLESRAGLLDFGEFKISRVGTRFEEFREVFSSFDVDNVDWIFEKSYLRLPSALPRSPVDGIPEDIEDILFLLRLYRVGDIAFIRPVIVLPSGSKSIQAPYRAMNDLNSYSKLTFKIESGDCEPWTIFADRIRASQSWSSDWFTAARRFFLSGGAKQVDLGRDDVDRIVDYVTALESTLVPEKYSNKRRISNRAAALIAPDDSVEAESLVRFMKTFYEIRSRITHGSRIGDRGRAWLRQNFEQIEDRVRQVLVTAVEGLPPREDDRRVALARLYDLTDADRGSFAIDKFKEIETPEVRHRVAAEIARLVNR
ncbi:MAG TPA: hypothetical protein VKR43_22965 [Bryobacteraceae bacterium]|nr:hypothetical protein [Bryobacteraceae bacterium]